MKMPLVSPRFTGPHPPSGRRLACRLCLPVSLLLFPFIISGRLQAEAESAPPLIWEDVKPTDYSIISPLRDDETVQTGDQAILIGSRLFWSGTIGQTGQEEGKGNPALIFRDILSKESGRFAMPSAILGMAVDPARGHLAVRLREAMMWIDPQTGEETDRITLPVARNRQPVVFVGRRLLILDENRLDTYDADTGQKLKEGASLPLDRVQRVIGCGSHLYLWSSYGGAKFIEVEAASPAAHPVEIKTSVSHSLLWKSACIDQEKETLGIFVPASAGATTATPATNSSAYFAFLRVKDRLVPVVPGMQRLSDGAALRHSPRRDRVTFALHVRAEKDMQEGGEIALTIPPALTTEQILSAESFPSKGDVRSDHLGNRTLFLPVPAMRKGEERDLIAYRTELVRYKVDFEIETTSTPFQAMRVPQGLKVYLDDEPQYRINDPYLVDIRNHLQQEAHTVESYANAVYREIRKRLVYKQDGRFDPAPTVLQNGHGSCTEHSYAQIALLRGAGIPARLAWNWLPVGAEPAFNHKIAEVWLPRYGWVPAEPLSSPRISVGTTYGQHLIFASLERPKHEFIRGGDRLSSFTRGSGNVDVKISIEPVSVSVAERSIPADGENGASTSDDTVRPRAMTVEEQGRAERSVE